MTQQLTRFHASVPVEYYEFAPLANDWQHDARSAFVRQMLVPAKATQAEWETYVGICNAFRLNPLMNPRPVWCIERRERDENGNWQASCPPQLGIAAYRIFAARSGEYGGGTPPEWCGPDGVFRSVWVPAIGYDKARNIVPVYPTAARVGVWRTGFREPQWGVALWEEAAQTHTSWKDDPSGAKGRDGKTRRIPAGEELNSLWKKWPSMMLAKVAEKQALTKAFPEQIPEDRVGRYFSVGEPPQRQQHRPALTEQQAATAGLLYPDEEHEDPSEGEYTDPGPEPPASQQSEPQKAATGVPPLGGDARGRRLRAAAGRAGWNEDRLLEHLGGTYGAETLAQLTAEQAEDLLKYLMGLPAAAATAAGAEEWPDGQGEMFEAQRQDPADQRKATRR